MDPSTSIVQIVTSWQTYVAACAVVAVVQVVKQIVVVAYRGKAPGMVTKLAVQASSLVVGALIGLIPGFLAGATTGERVLVGVVAGLLSDYLYRVLRRRLPALSAAGKAGGGTAA